MSSAPCTVTVITGNGSLGLIIVRSRLVLLSHLIEGVHQAFSCELWQPAFPNAEHLFQQAFAAQDPAPLLLHILKEHPTYLALRDLVSYYVEAVHNDPYRGQTLPSALARIIHSPDAPSFKQDALYELLFRKLTETHLKDHNDDVIAKVYIPKNTYLLDSLLSGFSFKYKLTSTHEMYGSIEDLKVPRGLDDSEPELLVVGICIQLLLHGSRLRDGFYQRRAGRVAKKLKAHQTAGTVKDPHVIELTIRHAETGLLQGNEGVDVWSHLVPSVMKIIWFSPIEFRRHCLIYYCLDMTDHQS